MRPLGQNARCRWPGLFLVGLLAALATSCAPKTEKRSAVRLEPARFETLRGWSGDRHFHALATFRRSCPRLLARTTIGHRWIDLGGVDWAKICNAAETVATNSDAGARTFFETWFRPHAVAGPNGPAGLVTGYFEAELRGSRIRTPVYGVPLYGLPRDHVTVDPGKFVEKWRAGPLVGRVVDGRLAPYHRRGAIEAGALDGAAEVLVWVDDAIDAYLLQVQGSGRVLLPDGGVLRIGFAGHNGHAYASIGRRLIERGELTAGRAGWGAIRGWVEAHPKAAPALFAENPRFIFFREIEGEGPIGAQGVALTPGRSLAVDPRFIPLGMPLWLESEYPGEVDRGLRRLMVAQDSGGAIKGPVRGDFFWGYGAEALALAGRMKSRGRYHVLLPKGAVLRIPES